VLLQTTWLHAQEELDNLGKKELKQLVLDSRADLQDSRQEVRRLEGELSRTKQNLESQISQRENLIATLKSQNGELSGRVEELEREIDTLRVLENTTRTELQATISRLRTELALQGSNSGSAQVPANVNVPRNASAPSAVKTYSGNYFHGTAKYDYYEDADGNRVYHGPFSYKCDENSVTDFYIGTDYRTNNFNSGYPVCSGNFNRNQKSGLWRSAIVDNNDKGNDTLISAAGNYIDGKKEGVWRFAAYEGWGENRKQAYVFLMGYNAGLPSGKFNFSWTDPESYNPRQSLLSVRINGQFTSDGKPDGPWLTTMVKEGITYEVRESFIKGVQVRYSVKDMSTGKMLYSLDQSEDYQADYEYPQKDRYGKPVHIYMLEQLDVKLTFEMKWFKFSDAFIDLVYSQANSSSGPFYCSVDWMFDEK
jgi:hypothetical protein